ncbi:MAG TPA: ester cyclase [Anaerolineales bacterium]|nr:ester cyclase [Anaerolineales bacterium]
MSTETNKEIVRRFIMEAFDQGNLAVVDEIVAPDQVNGGPGALPAWPGPEGNKMLITAYRNAFPDLHFTIDEQIAEGNTVVTRWTAHGTHSGEFAGLPPTGKSATVVGMGLDRVENGKIVESWGLFDQFGMLQQLGVLPAPTQSGR